MRNYDEFAAALRREVTNADLGRGGPDFRRLEGEPPAGARALARPSTVLRLAVAGALAVALGVGGYVAYHGYDSRRLLAENNGEFLETLFARGLFEAEAAPTGFEGVASGTLFDAGAAASQTSGSDWIDSGIAD